VKDLLSSLETEYGFAALGEEGKRIDHRTVAWLFGRALTAGYATMPAMEGGWFLGNGARLYWDAGEHPEYATAECAGHPRQLVAHIRAGHLIMERLARRLVGRRGIKSIRIWRGNVDYASKVSWGSHENHLVTRRASDLAPDLIPFLVSRVVYSGAGGFSLKDPDRFSLSPRLELFKAASTIDTMDARGIINLRSEDHAEGFRRLHLICRDSLISPTADLLTIGMTRLVVAIADLGLAPATGLELSDPVRTLGRFCSDPSCRSKVRTSQRPLGAIDIQRHYLDAIDRARSVLPDWTEEIVELADAVLTRLATDPEDLVGVLDWPTKRALFQAMDERPAAELQLQDLLLSQLDSPLERLLQSGDDPLIVKLEPAELEGALRCAPQGTRARIRGAAVRRLTGSPDAFCSWARLMIADRTLNLADPFEKEERWEIRPPAPEEGEDLEIPAFLRRRRRADE
jgi:proteasome accessory factor A